MAAKSATYVFTHRAVLERAPKASGVYSIFNSKRWVHVGESDDIQQSLFSLLNEPNPCLQRFSSLSFSFAPSPPAERAAQLEAMVAARNPACTFELNETEERHSPESSAGAIPFLFARIATSTAPPASSSMIL